MKNSHLFPILFCMFSMLLQTSCENSELKPSVSLGGQPILPRGNCQDCPGMDECCCSVELDQAQAADVLICGVPDGDFCPGTHTGCGIVPFTNKRVTFSLSTSSSIGDFCMDEGAGFFILNQGNQTSVNITCQRGQSNPQIVNVPLAASAKAYFTVNNSCELITCD